MTKVNYLDETLKRLPLIVLCGSGLWYGITKLNTIETKIEKIELLSFKDKESIDSKFNEVQILTQNNSNRTTEIEKDIIRLMAILPNQTEIKRRK
ncbi:MAG: hypothetical protein IPG89_21580 [Bacteroidetes bacterium]|nr:hypothetical protein [Bacteroidota bacterium]